MEEKIIEFVRNNKILYDKAHGGYKNIIIKEKRWEEVASQVNQPVEKVKKRWKTMRDRYYRIIKEEKCASGSGQKVPAAEKYKYFEALSFLRECEHFNSSTVGNFENMEAIEYEDANPEVCDVYEASNICASSTPRSANKKTGLDVHKEMLSAISNFKEREKLSPIMLFMQSVALQIEAADLSPERMLNFQSGVLNLVRDSISDPYVDFILQ